MRTLDQLRHQLSLIRVVAFCMKKARVLRYQLSAQQRLRSAWAHAQSDLSLCFAHTHFVGFVMSWLQRQEGIEALDGSPKSCSLRRYHGKHLSETYLNFGNWFIRHYIYIYMTFFKIFSSFCNILVVSMHFRSEWKIVWILIR